MANLSERQELFCREYLVDLNATQAAVRAGYKRHASNPFRLMQRPEVKERIAQLMEERKEVLNITSDYVLRRLEEIDRLDVADILDGDGNVLSVKDWPDAWRKSVSAVEVTQTRSAGEPVSCLKKVKLPDKLKNLELMGKHTDVSAFRDRMEITGKDGRELVIQVRKDELVDPLQDHLGQLKKNLSE